MDASDPGSQQADTGAASPDVPTLALQGAAAETLTFALRIKWPHARSKQASKQGSLQHRIPCWSVATMDTDMHLHWFARKEASTRAAHTPVP